MKDLKAIRGASLLREWMAEGEHEHQDFKFTISDARKIARSVSAFANNGGGRLLIGVKDNGVIAGVRDEEDIYVVEQAAERYCVPPQMPAFMAYRVEDNIRVIVAEISPAACRPVYVAEEGGARKAYYRVADENIAAHPLMVRAWELDDSTAPALTQRHYELAALYSGGVAMSERRAALALHISLTEAEDIIVRLAAARLIGFTFDGTRFIPKGIE